jgi:CTP:molybdopterin cytidylyltransferase MocA
MRDTPDAWAIVLAAGEGTRLRSLTINSSGTPVPKQFCSLYEGPCLLREALDRAKSIALPERTCVVVAEQHRHRKPSSRIRFALPSGNCAGGLTRSCCSGWSRRRPIPSSATSYQAEATVGAP